MIERYNDIITLRSEYDLLFVGQKCCPYDHELFSLPTYYVALTLLGGILDDLRQVAV